VIHFLKVVIDVYLNNEAVLKHQYGIKKDIIVYIIFLIFLNSNTRRNAQKTLLQWNESYIRTQNIIKHNSINR